MVNKWIFPFLMILVEDNLTIFSYAVMKVKTVERVLI